MRLPAYFLILLMATSLISGCGYTTGSLLPAHIKNIYIENFPNNIPITEESSDRRIYKTYRPRLELDVTKAIIDKFIFDGNLRVTQRQDADIILEGELADFRREPTKYGEGDDDVEQYRIVIVVDMRVTDMGEKKLMWDEKGFSGSDYYYTTGSQAKSESVAITDAIDDLARRVVERVIEVW